MTPEPQTLGTILIVWAGRQYKIFRSQRRKRVCRDLSPERANAILEYLYHHNVCNSVRWASCKTAAPLGPMSEVPL